jgi:hypothetical protein
MSSCSSLIEKNTRNNLFEYLKLSNFLGSNQSSERTFTFDDLRKKPLNIYAIREVTRLVTRVFV